MLGSEAAVLGRLVPDGRHFRPHAEEGGDSIGRWDGSANLSSGIRLQGAPCGFELMTWDTFLSLFVTQFSYL